MEPAIKPLANNCGLEIVDTIENARFELRTADSVTPASIAADRFQFPVTTAVEITTAGIRVPELTSIYLHADGELADTFDPSVGTLTVDAPKTLEIVAAPTKLFLRISDSATIRRDDTAVVIEFSGQTPIEVGVRSFHDRPAGTITTTADPEGAMQALSYLGSALKTTSPDRSFPTLRGHPPLIEVGDEFDAPDGIEPPETGVRIELPAEYQYIYPATSLAYYLGAEVVPGDRPRLVTDAGFEYDLAGSLGYEKTVGRVLRQTFLLDCLTRTEGRYEMNLHERKQVEDEVDLDFADLYDRPLAERLPAYLSVPFCEIEDQIPAWTLTVDIDPDPSRIAALPFIADDLAVVRTIQFDHDPAPTPDVINDFYEIDDADTEPVESDFFTPEPVEFDCLGHAWVGDQAPVGANKLTVDSLRRSLNAESQTAAITIHVVCNDPEMQAESVVSNYYDLNDRHQFDIELHTELQTQELRDLLTDPADFLHYIGHIDERGLVCSNGHLDAHTLNEVNVKAFLLNGCRSHEQGRALVDAGSLGGIITLSTVVEDVAAQVGTQLARLLVAGHTLRTSMHVVRDHLLSGSRWMTIGNGGTSLCQSKSSNPFLLRVARSENGTYQTEVEAFPTPSHGLGTGFAIYVAPKGRYLVGGHVDTLDLGKNELNELLTGDIIPVDYEGERYWSNEISADDFT